MSKFHKYFVDILYSVSLKILPFFYKKFKLKEKEIKKEVGKLFPVFIIGAPRTGSTFLYQALTNEYELTYIDNIVNLFYKNLPLGVWISNKLFKNKKHSCFKSHYGNTMYYNLHAPNEAGNFWRRWIPRGLDYCDKDFLNADQKLEIYNEINTVINQTRMPLLFKNMNSGLRIPLLLDIFPKAKFIWIRRNKEKTIKSILKARRELFGNEAVWWSIKPKNWKSLIGLHPEEQVKKQVSLIEAQIDKDTKNKLENVYEIDFENLLDDKEKELENIAQFIYPELVKK